MVVWVSLEFVAILLKKRMSPGKGWVGGGTPSEKGGEEMGWGTYGWETRKGDNI